MAVASSTGRPAMPSRERWASTLGRPPAGRDGGDAARSIARRGARRKPRASDDRPFISPPEALIILRMTAFVRTPERVIAEYRADAVTHALGVAFALIAGPVIVALAPEGAARASAAVYAATLLATFGFSAAYNLLTESPWRDWLRQLDHGAIYLKIAGSYTPFAVVSFPPEVGAKLLLGVWTVAVIGFGVKIAAPRRFNLSRSRSIWRWAGRWCSCSTRRSPRCASRR
jgi:hypothetical protein